MRGPKMGLGRVLNPHARNLLISPSPPSYFGHGSPHAMLIAVDDACHFARLQWTSTIVYTRLR